MQPQLGVLPGTPVLLRWVAAINLVIYLVRTGFLDAPRTLDGLFVAIVTSFLCVVAADCITLFVRLDDNQTRILHRLKMLEQRMGGSEEPGEDPESLT